MSAASALAAVLAHPAAPLGAVVGVDSSAGRDVAVGGSATLDGVAVTRDTSFDLASVTKVVGTTTAVLRLVHLGLLRLDDPVSLFVPDSPCAPGTTVRHLLLHRAGLWEWQPLYFADTDPFATIAGLPPRYALDAGRHYSDLGFQLLGHVIAHAAAAPLDQAIRALVTEPLGLARTAFGPADAPVASSALGDAAEQQMTRTGVPYPILIEDPGFAWRDSEITGVANDGNCFHAFGGIAGHAGLFSTVDDLLALGSALAAPEENAELWHPDLVTEFFRDGPDEGQAVGWRSENVVIDGREERMLWHPGFTGCALGIVPALRTTAVVLSNRLLAPEPVPTQTLWHTALPELLGGRTATEERTTPS